MPNKTKRLVEIIALAVGGVLLLILIVSQIDKILRAFPSEDYLYFRASAQMLIDGISPYSRPKLFYPLPTVLWLFVPFLEGDWTRWVWTLAPIGFMHIALGRKAVFLWPFYPLLVHMRYGQVDGWTILPIMFLLADKKIFAPISAALTLFKPQVAWLLGLYRIGQWLKARTWKNFYILILAALILVVPAFILQPNWVSEWIASVRAHPAELNQNATIWGWLYFGSLGIFCLGIELLAAIYFVRRARDRASSLHLFGLLVTPILYAYDYVLVTPTLKTWRETVLMTIISWLAVGIDYGVGGWGGAYSLIPLAALAFRAFDQSNR